MKKKTSGRARLYACIEAANHHVPIGEVLGISCRVPVVRARWAVMRRLRDDGFSTTQIGGWLDRDHSTIVHGLQREAALRASNG